MSFLTRRLPAPRSDGEQPPPAHRAANQALLSCARRLADLAAQAAQADQADQADGAPPLHDRLLAAVLELERTLADPAPGEAIRSGRQAWSAVAPALVGLLLELAGAALAEDPSLTGLIADTVLLVRPASPKAWRLRALAHEQWGDLGAAIAAHEQYVVVVAAHADKLDVRGRLRDLRELRAGRQALVGVLNQAAERGSALPSPTTGLLLGLLTRPARQDAVDGALDDFVDDLGRLPGPDLVASLDVLHAAIRCRRTAAVRPGPLPEADVREIGVVRLGDVRSWLAGKTICLVGPQPPGGAGKVINDYDLVARFTPFRIEAARTGGRTDLLITRHDEATGWDHPTDLRLILAEDPRDWTRAVRRKVVPAAQCALFEKALRRPAHQPALLGDDVRPGRPSGPFQLLRLLHHLDVSTRVDLIGFTLDDFPDVERGWLLGVTGRPEHRVTLR